MCAKVSKAKIYIKPIQNGYIVLYVFENTVSILNTDIYSHGTDSAVINENLFLTNSEKRCYSKRNTANVHNCVGSTRFYFKRMGTYSKTIQPDG